MKSLWRLIDAIRGRVIDGRGQPRRRALGEPAVLAIGTSEEPVRLLDWSPSGAMIALGTGLASGTYVTLRMLDRPAVRGQVRWSQNGRAGLSFEGDAPDQASWDEQ